MAFTFAEEACAVTLCVYMEMHDVVTNSQKSINMLIKRAHYGII